MHALDAQQVTAEQSSLCASDPFCKPSYSRLLDVWRSAPLRCGVRCLLAGRRARFSGAAPPLIDEHFAHARRDAGVRASAAESEERGRWCAQLKPCMPQVIVLGFVGVKRKVLMVL